MTELESMFNHEAAWGAWKMKFNPSLLDDPQNIENFKNNHKFILNHNLKETSYKLAHNQHSHLNTEQYKKLLKGFTSKPKNSVDYVDDPKLSLPSSVNWVSTGALNPVQNQGQCGSCYAFSATCVIESQVYLQTKKLLKLSEQNAMDGSSKDGYGNSGGDGGLMDNVFEYVKDHGLGLESKYPYLEEAYVGEQYDSKHKAAGLTSYVNLPQGSEHALITAVGTVGPVAVGIDASQPTFQFYSSGVYYDKNCSPYNLDHAVVVVGYGTVNNQDYYIVRNSWGTSWGQKGYVLMARNKNNAAGIASMASYPVGCYAV
jgi:cathepsin L